MSDADLLGKSIQTLSCTDHATLFDMTSVMTRSCSGADGQERLEVVVGLEASALMADTENSCDDTISDLSQVMC